MALNPLALLQHQRAVRLLILDVDGVLTDGSLFLSDTGEQYKAFSSRDGHGLRMLQDAGLTVAILTGRVSGVVEHRMRDLGIENIVQGRRDKGAALDELLAHCGIAAEQAAFMGDDVVDLPAMRRVYLSIAVADAHPLVAAHAHWTTVARGGHGAVREVCDTLLEAQGLLEAIYRGYLEA